MSKIEWHDIETITTGLCIGDAVISRKKKGLSAYKLSKIGGISITQIRMIEEGKTNYTVDTLLRYINGIDMRFPCISI